MSRPARDEPAPGAERTTGTRAALCEGNTAAASPACRPAAPSSMPVSASRLSREQMARACGELVKSDDPRTAALARRSSIPSVSVLSAKRRRPRTGRGVRADAARAAGQEATASWDPSLIWPPPGLLNLPHTSRRSQGT